MDDKGFERVCFGSRNNIRKCSNCPDYWDCSNICITRLILNGMDVTTIMDHMRLRDPNRCDWQILCHIGQMADICDTKFKREQVIEAIQASDIMSEEPGRIKVETSAVLKAFGVYGRKGKKKKEGVEPGEEINEKAPNLNDIAFS